MPRASIDDNYRFTMQIPPIEKARLIRAAAIEHTTLKDFLLRNSLSAAAAVIERAEHVALSKRDTCKILDLLDHPREPNARMVEIRKKRSHSS